MAEKLPIRTVFDESGNATGLAEFQSGEFIGVTYGGIGTNTLTTNSILLGNGTSAVQNSVIQISGSTISGLTISSSIIGVVSVTYSVRIIVSSETVLTVGSSIMFSDISLAFVVFFFFEE